jgi:hypothetical protein
MSVQYPIRVERGEWLDPYRFRREDGKLFWIQAGLNSKFKPVRDSPRKWRREVCRALGRTIDFDRVPCPGNPQHPEVYVYSDSDLRAAVRAHELRRPGGFYRSTTPGYLTRRELVEKYRVSLGFEPYWSRRPSRLHAGMALRSRKQACHGPGAGGGSEVLVYREEDVEAILDGRESSRHGTGRPAARRLRLPERNRAAAEFLRGLLAGGPVLSAEVYLRAKLAKVALERLLEAKRTLGVRCRRQFGPPGGSPRYWFLPGHQPPAILRPGQSAPAPANGPAVRDPAPPAAAPARKRRGRPLGWKDAQAEERNRRMVEAWDAGKFATPAELGRAFHVSRTRASKILKAHGRRSGPACT